MIISRLIDTPTKTSPARTAAAPAAAKKKSCHSSTLFALLPPFKYRRKKCKRIEHDSARHFVEGRLLARIPCTGSPQFPRIGLSGSSDSENLRCRKTGSRQNTFYRKPGFRECPLSATGRIELRQPRSYRSMRRGLKAFTKICVEV